ncbi:MAG: acetylxylan esterase [Lentisphaerae bacterium]|nr:acetylxylan esterase [Lentisphaerota bacterium]
MGKKVPSSMLVFDGDKKHCREADKYASVQIFGKTDKSPLSYQPGEEMIFSFEADFGDVKPGKWSLVYERKGDDHRTFSGKVPADQPLTVKTSIAGPGFVNVNVYLVNGRGTRLTKLDYRNKQAPIGFFAGAGVHIETLRDCGEPEDFDEFWAKQKKRLELVPFKDQTERILEKEMADGFIYAVSIPAPGPRPATGYMTIPRGAKKKSLPILITFNGYGLIRQLTPESIMPGCIHLHINAHGQKLGQSDAYYEEFFKSICTGNVSYTYDPELNKNPETCFFNGMVMRVLRALEYLKTCPEWDGRNITASGNSQGGLQTMWAAALDKDVTKATPAVTWCCDMAGSAKANRLSGLYPIAYQPALDYYDPVFMAKRITRAEVTILRGGLGDYNCPPTGVAISYLNLATPHKTIHWYQGSDHGFVPKNPEIITWTTQK